jgi:Sulfotransferase family
LQQFPDDPLRHGRLAASMQALGLPREAWLDEFGRALVRIYSQAAASHGKQRWADKSPENAINIAEWDRLLHGRLHFVLVIRHPYDVIASMMETPMPLVISQTLEGRANHVSSYMSSGLDYRERHPERSTILRYEDLVMTPEQTMTDLLDRLGEKFEAALLNELQARHHGTGLEDPKALRWSGISQASIGRWQRDIPTRQIELLRHHFGFLLPRLGYLPS